MAEALPAQYDPRETEPALSEWWEREGFFRVETEGDDPPFTVLMPPPNVTGELHVGHALFVTLQDTLVRWRRMQGDAALWIPGTDHAGIATQMVVERELRTEGLTRHDLGREPFLERVWDGGSGRVTASSTRCGASAPPRTGAGSSSPWTRSAPARWARPSCGSSRTTSSTARTG